MNSVREFTISDALLKEALETHYRATPAIKSHQDVKFDIDLPPTINIKMTIIEDKGVESKLVHGKDG